MARYYIALTVALLGATACAAAFLSFVHLSGTHFLADVSPTNQRSLTSLSSAGSPEYKTQPEYEDTFHSIISSLTRLHDRHPVGQLQQTPTLVAVTTSNVWGKTQLMLSSLWTTRDTYDLMVVDEGSTDGTLAYLAKYNVTVLPVPEAKGVVSCFRATTALPCQSTTGLARDKCMSRVVSKELP